MVPNTRDIFVAIFSAQNLLQSLCGCFDSVKPYLLIHRKMEDETWLKVWQNEPNVRNSMNPIWPLSRIPMTALCNGDINRPIKIEIWGYQRYSQHQFMGCVETTVRGLLDKKGSPFDLIDSNIAMKTSYVNSGTLVAANVQIEQHPSLAEVNDLS